MAVKKIFNEIDRNQIKEELATKQILEVQKQLYRDRQVRFIMLTLLLIALMFTLIYGTIENPFQYTFSKIGNRFNITNRVWFIIWAISTGTIIQLSIVTLFKLENYKNKRQSWFVISGSAFLVMSSLAPSLPDLTFWTNVHLVTAGLFALLLTMGFFPFALWVARENPRLKRIIYIWLTITWGGGSFWYITLGNTGMFEMWFFVFIIVFLLYLSLSLFEEKIVKHSIVLLRDEENLNIGIEKIFINLEAEERENRKKKKD